MQHNRKVTSGLLVLPGVLGVIAPIAVYVPFWPWALAGELVWTAYFFAGMHWLGYETRRGYWRPRDMPVLILLWPFWLVRWVSDYLGKAWLQPWWLLAWLPTAAIIGYTIWAEFLSAYEPYRWQFWPALGVWTVGVGVVAARDARVETSPQGLGRFARDLYRALTWPYFFGRWLSDHLRLRLWDNRFYLVVFGA